jgi:hypothetical protein
VERRLGRAVFDVAAERSLEVEVTRFGNIYRSDVYVRDASGHAVGHRQLQSDEPGCSALVNATALAIALVIDPEAAARAAAPAAAVAAFEPPAPAPAAAAPASPVPAPLPAPSPPPAPELEMRLPSPASLTPVTLSGRVAVLAGLVPATAPGFELAFSARPSARWGYAFAASLAPSQTATRGIGSLDVGLSRVSALVTFDAGHSERARLVLAGGPSVGAFHVAVRAPAPVTDPGDYWFLAAQLAVNLQLAVTKDIFIEIGGAGLVPLRRQEFLVRQQSDPVWRQPLVSGLGFVGAGATFP